MNKGRAGRTYTEEELALFATYCDHRAEVAPRQCHQGPRCWVLLGPPAIKSNAACHGCGGYPKLGVETRQWRNR